MLVILSLRVIELEFNPQTDSETQIQILSNSDSNSTPVTLKDSTDSNSINLILKLYDFQTQTP